MRNSRVRSNDYRRSGRSAHGERCGAWEQYRLRRELRRFGRVAVASQPADSRLHTFTVCEVVTENGVLWAQQALYVSRNNDLRRRDIIRLMQATLRMAERSFA